MKTFRLLAGLTLAMALSACASAPRLPADCIAIGPAGALCPLPPAQLPKVSAQHLVKITQPSGSQTFLGRLEVTPHALRLAGASLFGTHLFTVVWDGKNVTSEPPLPKMHPRLMVAMLETALADPAALRAQLHGMTLTVAHTGDTQTRTLTERGRVVARITQHGGELARARLTMAIPPAHLTLQLTPLGATR
ncbi:MAG TPA: DUF3261 domain-containing protein [Rhodanobacteraceae bacterium]